MDKLLVLLLSPWTLSSTPDVDNIGLPPYARSIGEG